MPSQWKAVTLLPKSNMTSAFFMEMNIQPTSAFETSDYWLAAALLASGKVLKCLRWEGRRAYFQFDSYATCEMAAHAYWAGDLQVRAKAFADALRTLKDRLYGDENGNRNTPHFKIS